MGPAVLLGVRTGTPKSITSGVKEEKPGWALLSAVPELELTTKAENATGTSVRNCQTRQLFVRQNPWGRLRTIRHTSTIFPGLILVCVIYILRTTSTAQVDELLQGGTGLISISIATGSTTYVFFFRLKGEREPEYRAKKNAHASPLTHLLPEFSQQGAFLIMPTSLIDLLISRIKGHISGLLRH